MLVFRSYDNNPFKSRVYDSFIIDSDIFTWTGFQLLKRPSKVIQGQWTKSPKS